MSYCSEVERRQYHAEQPDFRINELQIPPTQKVRRHSYSNMHETSYKEGVSYQPTERRDSKWRNDLA